MCGRRPSTRGRDPVASGNAGHDQCDAVDAIRQSWGTCAAREVQVEVKICFLKGFVLKNLFVDVESGGGDLEVEIGGVSGICGIRSEIANCGAESGGPELQPSF